METISHGNEKYNVCLITIDSCRFDTAQKARTPSLNSLSKLMCAESHTTYTYPSHHSLFIGILPKLVEKDDKFIQEYDQLWRSGGVRSTQKKVLESFVSSSIIEHYQTNGYNVQGFGGVQFFNPNLYCNSLCKIFNNFTYFGPETFEDEYKIMPRKNESMPLGNINSIVESVSTDDPYFLFINCSETHLPYDTENLNVTDEYVGLIKRLQHEHSTKIRKEQDDQPFSLEEIEVLRNAQVKALEYVDKKLGELFDKLPKQNPTLTIVLADHGEEFGEEGRYGHAHNSSYVTKVPVWSGWLNK